MNHNPATQRLKSLHLGKQFEKDVEAYLNRRGVLYVRIHTHVTRICPHCKTWNNIAIPGLKGNPDFFIFLPEGVVLIELKAGKGKLSPEQKVLKAHYEALGYRYFICYSLGEVKKILEV